MSANNGRIPTIQEAISVVESSEGLTLIEKVDASERLRLNLSVRETFMSFRNNELRVAWIKKRLCSPVVDQETPSSGDYPETA